MDHLRVILSVWMLVHVWTPVRLQQGRVIIPEPKEAGPPLMACAPQNDSLKLTCSNDSVVTANVYSVAETIDSCVYNGAECLIKLDEVKTPWLWKSPYGVFKIEGMNLGAQCPNALFRVKYLVAMDFKCVPRTLLLPFCDATSVKTSSQRSGYLFNEEYPIITGNIQHNCKIKITKQANETLFVQSLDLSMNPQKPCKQYVQIQTFTEGGLAIGDTMQFCEHFQVNISYPTSEITYVLPSGQLKMLLFFEALPGVIIDEGSAEVTGTTSSLSGVTASRAGEQHGVNCWTVLLAVCALAISLQVDN